MINVVRAHRRNRLPAVHSRNTLTANQSSVETDTTGLVAITNCTVAGSTLFASRGSASLEMTVSATGFAQAGAVGGTSGVPVVVGQTYTTRGVMRMGAALTRSCRAGVSWFTSGGGLITEDESGLVALSSSAFVFASYTGTAPATAAFARPYMVVSSAGGTTTGEKYYIDELGFYLGADSTYR